MFIERPDVHMTYSHGIIGIVPSALQTSCREEQPNDLRHSFYYDDRWDQLRYRKNVLNQVKSRTTDTCRKVSFLGETVGPN